MLRWFRAGRLQDVQEGDHVGVQVGVRVGDGVAHARLGRKVDDARRGEFFEQGLRGAAVGEVDFLEAESGLAFEPSQACALEHRVVVVVQVVHADDLVPPGQQGVGHERANEAGDAGHEDFHSRPSTTDAGSRCLTSKTTLCGLPKARIRSAPSSRNASWATATTIAS